MKIKIAIASFMITGAAFGGSFALVNTAFAEAQKTPDGSTVPKDKILWDRLETPDLPKAQPEKEASPTASPTPQDKSGKSGEASIDKDLENSALRRDIDILKDRMDGVEKKLNERPKTDQTKSRS